MTHRTNFQLEQQKRIIGKENRGCFESSRDVGSVLVVPVESPADETEIVDAEYKVLELSFERSKSVKQILPMASQLKLTEVEAMVFRHL